MSLPAPLHSGEDASLPLSSGGNYQILVNNVFYFTQRVVDKLWQGMFSKDSKLVVDFIVQLIGQVQTTNTLHTLLMVHTGQINQVMNTCLFMNKFHFH